MTQMIIEMDLTNDLDTIITGEKTHMIRIRKVSLFIVTIGVALWLPQAPSLGKERCANMQGEFATIKEMAKGAEYIGLYSVLSVSMDKESKFEDMKSYTYTLDKSSTLKPIEGKKTAPSKIYVTGREPFTQIPQVYFYLDRRHADAVKEKYPAKWGLSPMVKYLESEDCAAAPWFMVGYKYLILGNYNSTISYEPIHSTYYDEWYVAVKKAIGE